VSERNAIQTAFDEFGKSSGCTKKSGSWYRRSSETIVVLNLQKSQYAMRYYVNVAVWLLALGDTDAPKENKCHVRTRLTKLVPRELEDRVNELLDLATPIDDMSRREEFLGVLDEHLRPLMDGGSTLEGLRSGTGKRLVERSLVTRSSLNVKLPKWLDAFPS
jgi:uncharacterized protein DUF4304